MLNPPINGKIHGFSRPLSVFQVFFKANLIFKDFSRQSCIFKYFSSLCEPCCYNTDLDITWSCWSSTFFPIKFYKGIVRKWPRDVFFYLSLNVPVNNFSVMLGRVFVGWSSTKQGLMCLAQGHNAVMLVRLKPTILGLQSSILPLSHCAPPWDGHFPLIPVLNEIYMYNAIHSRHSPFIWTPNIAIEISLYIS